MRKVVLISLLGLCALVHWGRAQSLDLAEVWRMGDSEDDAVLFGEINSVGIDSKGQAYVVDWGHSGGVYVFSRDGALHREIGREGRGPGEFERLSRVVVSNADTVFAWDEKINRVTIFSPDNYDVVKTVRVSWESRTSPTWLIGAVPEGFLIVFTAMFVTDNPQTDLRRDVYLIDRTGQQRLPVVVPMPTERLVLTSPGERESGFLIMPFSGKPVSRVSDLGLVYSGHGDSTAIIVRSVDGQAKRRIELTYDPVPVTSEDLDKRFKGTSRAYRRILREAGLPKIKPMFQHFVVDDREHVWVKLSTAYGGNSAVWLIFDEEGNQVNSTELPINVSLEAVRNDRAYGVLTEESGAEVLVAYTIHP